MKTLRDLELRGIEVVPRSGGVRVHGLQAALAPALIQKIRESKSQLLAELSRRQARAGRADHFHRGVRCRPVDQQPATRVSLGPPSGLCRYPSGVRG